MKSKKSIEPFKGIKGYNKFLHENVNQVTMDNLNMLKRTMMFIAIGILSFFTYFLIDSRYIRWSVFAGIYLLIYIAVIIFLYLYFKKRLSNPLMIRTLTILFLATTFSFGIIVSVFPQKEYPGIIFPMLLIALPSMFTLTIYSQSIILTLFTTIYILSSYFEKKLEVFYFDLYSSCVALVLSLTLLYLYMSVKVKQYNRANSDDNIFGVDKLTGLLDSNGAIQKCNEYFSITSDAEKCALFLIDIDNFSSINEILGHKGGDEYLKAFSTTIKDIFRGDDIIARIEEDEYIIIMKNINNVTIVESKAKQIISLVSTLFIDRKVHSSCSIGVAISNKSLNTYNKLFQVADRALYNCKHNGKNKFNIANRTKESGISLYKKIMLVVDDDELNREIIKTSFFENYEIYEASNGEEAMKALNKLGEYISVIILDIRMPKMNGFEVLQEISNDSHYRHIPVIVTTGYIEEELKALADGAVDVVIKPYNIDVLRKRIEIAITKK